MLNDHWYNLSCLVVFVKVAVVKSDLDLGFVVSSDKER